MHKSLSTGILITFGILIICIISGCGDNPPEEVTDPPQSEDDVQPSPTITVMVDLAPRAIAYFIQGEELKLQFSEEVMSVKVNGRSATGSGRDWRVYSDHVPYGKAEFLTIEWINRDGSKDYSTVGPYAVVHNSGEPPEITSGTVWYETDVDPAAINGGGLRYDFNEPVTGTIKLTDEVGADLNWTAIVAGQTATLTAVAGQELVSGTTYKIEIDVHDGAGNQLKATITFVTKPK